MAIFGFVNSWWRTRAGLTELARVVRIEIEVLRTYDRVIGKVGHPGTADQLAQFRNEHAKHLEDLFAWKSLARRFPERLRNEVHGRHSGFGGAQSMTDDTEGALREVRAVEQIAIRAWNALEGALPRGMGALVNRFREDETRHLRFLDRLLESKVWDLEETVPETP